MMGNSIPVSRTVLSRFLDLVHDAMYTEFMTVGFSLAVAVMAGFGADLLRQRRVVLAVLLVAVFFDLLRAGAGLPGPRGLLRARLALRLGLAGDLPAPAPRFRGPGLRR